VSAQPSERYDNLAAPCRNTAIKRCDFLDRGIDVALFCAKQDGQEKADINAQPVLKLQAGLRYSGPGIELNDKIPA